MWNKPTNVQLQKLPARYATERIPEDDKIVRMHFFLGGSDWYAVEYDCLDRLFFGYAILNNDLHNSEWGYFSFDELRNLRTSQGFEVERNLQWKPTKALEIDNIREALKVRGRL